MFDAGSRLGRGWGVDYTPDVRLAEDPSDGSVIYYGPGGLTGKFTLVSGSTSTYVSAAGFKSDLVKSGSTWTMTDHNAKTKRTFNATGALTSVEDRNGNTTTVAVGGSLGNDVTVLTPAGPNAARTATVKDGGSGQTILAQPNVATPRQVSFSTPYSDMTQYTDALGRSTTFGYTSAGLLSSISAPGSVNTNFGYDASNRVTSITQTDTSTGGSGTSITRLVYTSSTQTLMASPNTDQGSSVSSVPHTTYTLDGSQRVTNALDAAGRTRAKTYTANFDTASSTAGTGTGASTTTNTYGANSNESLTKRTEPTGAAQSLTYANPAPNQFLPDGATDDAGNASTYTYNGTGNQLTSTDAGSNQAKVTCNTDGTVATATSPGNGTNSTGYGYTDKQMTSMTPVTGSSLTSRTFTYDQYGRLATATNGRGITTTYGYDVDDRATAVSYSTGPGVTYGYDAVGKQQQSGRRNRHHQLRLRHPRPADLTQQHRRRRHHHLHLRQELQPDLFHQHRWWHDHLRL